MFFLHSTAYELRISDWSPDVCSSDLPPTSPIPAGPAHDALKAYCCVFSRLSTAMPRSPKSDWRCLYRASARPLQRVPSAQFTPAPSPHQPRLKLSRSEEHTSELQSLMRISYAVFCLKKKNYIQHST